MDPSACGTAGRSLSQDCTLFGRPSVRDPLGGSARTLLVNVKEHTEPSVVRILFGTLADVELWIQNEKRE